MLRFENILKPVIAEALNKLYGISVSVDEITLAETRKEFEGDTTLVVFPYIKASKKSPEQTGNEIGEFLNANSEIVSGYNAVKGFLNISIADSFWKQFFSEASKDRGNFLKAKISSKPKHLMVEYSSPNTNKPLHLGHIRNNLLGYSVAEILKAVGHDVVKVNLVNDRGVHICKSMLAWKKYGKGETPESTKMKGDHLVGRYYVEYDKQFKEEVRQLMAKEMTREEAEKEAPLAKEVQEMLRRWEAGDKETLELWNMMNGWVYKGFDETYKTLGGVTCDSDDYYNTESHVNQVYMPKLQEPPEEPLYLGFFHTGAYQESLGGYGGIQHCLVPAPKHVIIDRDEDGEITTRLFAKEQSAKSMLKILGY